MAQAYAGILGPLAMLIAVARGLIHGHGAEAVLLAAWLSLLAFAAAGYVIGWLAQRVVDEAVETRIASELSARDPSPSAEAALGS